MVVPLYLRISITNCFDFFSPLGKNPTNWNLLVGRPLPTRDDMTAEGPGSGTIWILFAFSFFINLYPGSEISGVPASEIMPPILPFFKLFNIWTLTLSVDLSL